MKREKILLCEQETRNVETFNQIEDIINFKKSLKKGRNKLLSTVGIISIVFGSLLYYDNLGILNFGIALLYMIFAIFVCSKYAFLKNNISKEELDKIFLKRYEIEPIKQNINTISMDNIRNINTYAENIFEQINIDKIEYGILFLTERYVYSENKSSIKQKINTLKKRIEDNKLFILNKKKMLTELNKSVPYLSNVIDVESLELTVEEKEIEKSEQKKLKEDNKKLKEDNKKLKEEINNLKKYSNKSNHFEYGGFRGI